MTNGETGMTVKELLLELRENFANHAQRVDNAISELSTASKRHDEVLPEVDDLRKDVTQLQQDKRVSDARAEERSRLIRAVFGVSLVGAVAGLLGIAVAVATLLQMGHAVA